MLKKTFITSDFHFDHANIIKYARRPFSSVEEMNRELVRRYNSRVTDLDTVYILGDITLGRDLSHAKKLRGRKKLLIGNHDKLPIEAYEAVGFEVLKDGGSRAKEFMLDGIKFVHSPMTVMRTRVPDMVDMPDGYRDLLDSGKIGLFDEKCVCGHVHSIFKKIGCFVNVSVDVWDFYPVEFDEVKSAFEETSKN
jgi:calcineurin-like phosphoesterase family protein